MIATVRAAAAVLASFAAVCIGAAQAPSDGAAAGPAGRQAPAVRPAKPATPDDLDLRPGMLQLVTDQPSGGRYLVFTYVIANKTGKTQRFSPRFDLLFGDGTIRTAGEGVPAEVGRRLQRSCASAQAMDQFQIMGEVHDGEPNARDGFVVWQAPPAADLKDLTLFVSGTSSAIDRVTDPSGKATIARRTWVRDYRFTGAPDARIAAQAEFDPLRDRWVMR